MNRPEIAIASKSNDSVWERIRLEGAQLVQNRDVLSPLVERVILQSDSFEAALAMRLAIRLGSDEVSTEDLLKLFENALLNNTTIAQSAKADLLATLERDPACHRIIDPFLYFKGWHAIQAYRIAHEYWRKGAKDIGYFIQSRVSLVTSIDIHPAAVIAKGLMIDHGHEIVIGETCVIEDNVSMMQGVTLGGNGKEFGDRHPKIKSGVLIGAGAKILGNIVIGQCSRVAAGSVVLHSVPANTTVAGIPAKVVGNSGSKEPAKIMNHQIEADEG